jgi:hypothetical protein
MKTERQLHTVIPIHFRNVALYSWSLDFRYAYTLTHHDALVHDACKSVHCSFSSLLVTSRELKGADPTVKPFPDPYAPRTLDLPTSFAHALLATALFRCWCVTLWVSAVLQTRIYYPYFSIEAHSAIFWCMVYGGQLDKS